MPFGLVAIIADSTGGPGQVGSSPVLEPLHQTVRNEIPVSVPRYCHAREQRRRQQEAIEALASRISEMGS